MSSCSPLLPGFGMCGSRRLPRGWLAAAATALLLGSVVPAQAQAEAQTRPAPPPGAVEPPVFDVHIAVITDAAGVRERWSRTALTRLVDELATSFVDAQGRPVIRFRVKDVVPYAALKDSRCPQFVALGDGAQPYDSEGWAAIFTACRDARVRDPQAINFYIYDSYSAQGDAADGTGHGTRNRNRPYVLIDWERASNMIQNPVAHEMGHAFGLVHVCAEGARRDSATNIMASADCKRGSGGLRNLGFDAEQVATIRRYASLISRQLQSDGGAR